MTGATGFLGRRVAAALARRGHAVLGISREPDAAARRLALEFVGWEPGLVSRFRPDALVHCATAYGRRGEPRSALDEANVRLPLSLLRALGPRTRLVAADTFYRKPGIEYVHLADYTASKRAFREAVAAQVPGATAVFAILEHVYGAGDDPDKALPTLVRRIVNGHGRLALTDGRQERDFLHVADAAAAMVHLLDLTLAPGTHDIEVGTGTPRPLREFLEMVGRRSGSEVELGFGDLPRRAGEPASSWARPGLLRESGWAPQVSLEAGVDEMITEARA